MAVITGAGGGMGRACARHLANSHALILTDYNPDRLKSTVHELSEDDNAEITAAIQGDIAEDTVIGKIAEVAEGCKLLVHTAGVSPALAGWQSIITTNLVGTAKLLAAFEPLLSPGLVGVLLSSTARCFVPPATGVLAELLDTPLAPDLVGRLEPLLGNDEQTRAVNAYAYSKAWVTQTVQQRAPLWASCGARIVSISPGFIRTPMTRTEVEERPEMKQLLDSTPIPRWGTVNDVADLVDFIRSDKASFITGTDIIVDGGLSASILTSPVVGGLQR